MNEDAATIIRVSRRFDATPERVFDAWLDPATAGRWLFATPTGEMQRVEIDARVGGRYAVVERREQGDAGHFGEYLVIDRPHRLVFTLAMEPDAPTGDRISIEIRPVDRGCELTLTHAMAAEYAEYATRTESGWRDVLASLVRQLADARDLDARDGDVAMNDYGIATAADTVRIERTLPGPIERVWRYLTDSDKREGWLAAGTMDLRVGGLVELRFHNSGLSADDDAPPAKYARHAGEILTTGRITACEAPRLLGYTWGGEGDGTSEVSFELVPQGDQVRLVLTHRRLADRNEMLSVAAGWHAHLGILVDMLAGRTPESFWTAHTRLEREYGRRLAPDRTGDAWTR